ncbi:MAG: hypothetical protein AB7L18_07580, partial [Hyphomicrobiaceae bacterium]
MPACSNETAAGADKTEAPATSPAVMPPVAAEPAARRAMLRPLLVRRAVLSFALTLSATLAGVGIVLHEAEQRMGPPPLAAADDLSTIVVDRDGRLLRAFTTESDRWRLPATRADVDSRYLTLLVTYEDRNF